MRNTDCSNYSNKTQPRFKDVSRFTRWVANMDKRDEGLSPTKRKTKWLLLLATLLMSFVLSFILFPSAKLDHETMGGPVFMHAPARAEKQAASSLGMPVDSFENLLKSKIHESKIYVPEKK